MERHQKLLGSESCYPHPNIRISNEYKKRLLRIQHYTCRFGMLFRPVFPEVQSKGKFRNDSIQFHLILKIIKKTFQLFK